MLFDLGFLNQVKNDSFIVHSAWNMETREENASRKAWRDKTGDTSFSDISK